MATLLYRSNEQDLKKKNESNVFPLPTDSGFVLSHSLILSFSLIHPFTYSFILSFFPSFFLSFFLSFIFDPFV